MLKDGVIKPFYKTMLGRVLITKLRTTLRTMLRNKIKLRTKLKVLKPIKSFFVISIFDCF